MVYAASAATDFDGLHGGETAVNASKVFWRGVVCALAGATLWGFSGACIQFLAESYEVSSAFISAVRAGVAALLFAVFVFVTRREALLSLLGSPAARPTLVLFGVGLYLSQITYAVSVALTNAGTATVLQATCTVFVMLITCARARRLPRVADFVGLMCAMAAATLIATQGDLGASSSCCRWRAWLGALPTPCPRRFSTIMAHPNGSTADGIAPTVIACGMVISGIVAILVWLIGEAIVSLLAAPSVALGAAGSILADLFRHRRAGLVPDMDATGWLALVGGVGVLGTFAAFGLFLYGVSLVGSVKGSLLGVAEPAGAMVIAALWLHTPFSAWDWIGLVLMAAMIALVSLSGTEFRRQKEALRRPAGKVPPWCPLFFQMDRSSAGYLVAASNRSYVAAVSRFRCG